MHQSLCVSNEQHLVGKHGAERAHRAIFAPCHSPTSSATLNVTAILLSARFTRSHRTFPSVVVGKPWVHAFRQNQAPCPRAHAGNASGKPPAPTTAPATRRLSWPRCNSVLPNAASRHNHADLGRKRGRPRRPPHRRRRSRRHRRSPSRRRRALPRPCPPRGGALIAQRRPRAPEWAAAAAGCASRPGFDDHRA